ncbi:branched-chain amino acid ABC transporter permease [Caldimonas thermodepolymerans]|jgi:branched-chain amino acid transport system permease protein|uniref:Amino acid/amide ABC transporter membrane protein 2 (HAAT family) n=2 Tax=Caldimonas thermodepolymerans TaxID=215580 RepID=A0AA46DEE4_9BURK|nr:amino acid/amide ABC transporter membrane protein 2 (HAAT family) [Caldimonas thermodepolymerans]TCP07060.1 amino acid/amide ABC transporter membrane protein 2 (HAAT family) [Caldimonas thermodepolymerans]
MDAVTSPSPPMTASPRAAAPGAGARTGVLDHPLHWPVALVLLALLVAFPLAAEALDESFYIGLGSRILIFALAATSLNLILGFGGMVSFGHAAFLGIGGYAVGILMQEGITSAWIAWPVAVAAAAAFSFVIGAISLRTRGVYFIMITLAFAQMLYYVMISLRDYGGEDGLPLPARSTLGALDLGDDASFYYVVLVLFVLAFLAIQRLLNARFGHVLQAARENETRMAAIGFPVYRYRLAAFTLAGALAGLAGALAANQSGIISPALMHWSQSGQLMVMVILGGVGHLYGGFVGALVLLLLEEIAVGYTIHWQFGVGAVLLLVVLVAPQGLVGLLPRRRGSA